MKTDVDFIDSMGNDLTIVNAARVSYGKTKIKLSIRDEKLLSYLASHQHWSPFSHTSLQFKVTCPIYVARQLYKHKVGLTENEISRRYVSYTPSYELPETWRGKPAKGKSKQGSSGEVQVDQSAIATLMDQCIEMYEDLIKTGVAPEQARSVLPMSTMTSFIWTGSLYAYFRVYQQRVLTEGAQFETKRIAEYIGSKCAILFPKAWSALRGHAKS